MTPQPEDRTPLPVIQWPAPFKTCEHLPDVKSLALAWKPLINGWDIVLGRNIIATPDQFTYWLPMLPPPTP